MAGLRRVLVANRGEIAIRIARAARALGMDAVMVYPPADELSLHTRYGDEAIRLDTGAADDPVAAYLDVGAVVGAAVEAGADCVHPGYGFLAENAELARACAEAGVTFVGPSPAALRLFGDKVAARDLARSLSVPVIEGSHGLSSPEEVADAANRIGYPVMIKASAGGGGRGMRAVTGPEDLASAYERCRSEAETAFGDGAVFLERLVADPRHIEVQILADRDGRVVHLHERDCSIQIRHQKVVEIAPAPELDPDLRAVLSSDAVRLIEGADLVNAATVEFLVDAATGDHHFIECNPRIQVEHTVTEQVTGIDLVEAQLLLAGGASLASLGLATQVDVPRPRGFAVQARVVATGPGTISAYKEPTGAGVRVDACGYAGLTPPPQFDPLLAKVVGSSGSAGSYVSAVNRTLTALDEFHLEGLPTNLPLLRSVLADDEVRAGGVTTGFLVGRPDPSSNGSGSGLGAGSGRGRTLELLATGASALTGPTGSGPTGGPGPSGPGVAGVDDRAGLAVPDGHIGVESPMHATVLEVRVAIGDGVAAGQALVVVHAMKMETVITAPADGVVAEIEGLSEGDTVAAGQVLAVLAPGEGGTGAAVDRGDDGWQPQLDEVDTLRRMALDRLAPGSDDPGVVRQRSRDKLTCRERIDLLLDDGSFREVGSVTGFASYAEAEDGGVEIDAFTPANHVGGWGTLTVDGPTRPAIVCADDFTSRGGHADGAIGEKSRYLDRLSVEMRIPSIRLLDGSSGGGSVASMVPEQRTQGESAAKESTGAIKAGRPRVAGGGGSFLPDHLGSTMYAEQLTTVPVVNVLLGSVVGIGAAKAVLGHFSTMVRDIAQLFVAGPPVVSHAMGYEITKEDLGDHRIHCGNGSVDNLAESEEEAMDQTRRFLSYLPASVYEAPPVIAPASGAAAAKGRTRRDEELLGLIPRKRTTTFDIRRAIELMADQGSFFEIGPHWGTDQVTGFVRFEGHPLGVIASDSRHANGGALTADGCAKLIRHIDLCDLFNVPVLNLVDNPGFAVGLEHEIAGTIRKGGEWMVAFAQMRVPMFTVLMRRSFGVAGNNYATPQATPSVRVTWPAADVGGIPPEGGIEAAYKRQLAETEDPDALRAELNARIESVRGPTGPLNRFQIEEMIDPRDTRRYICEWVPNAYRLVAQVDRLGPRAIQFRP